MYIFSINIVKSSFHLSFSVYHILWTNWYAFLQLFLELHVAFQLSS